MQKWNALGGFLVVCLAVSTAFGQTQEDMQGKLQNLEKRLAAVEAENATLKSQVGDQGDEALETQINSLLDRYAGTTVNSVANPITMTGEFRFRNYWQSGDGDTSFGFNPFNPFNPKTGISPSAFDDELDGSYSDALVRLGFMYEFTGDVTAYAEVQAHWNYGDLTSSTNGFFPSPLATGSAHGESLTPVTLHQGWVEVRNLFDRPELSSKTGRQEIALGNQFQFGDADWYSGWSFDGSVWTWDDESFTLTGIMARLSSLDRDLNQIPSYLSSHDDDELYSIYFTLKTIENHELDLYWIYVNGHGVLTSIGSLGNGVGNAAVFGSFTAYYHTIGARIGGTFPDIVDGLDWNAEIAFQFGDVKGATFTGVSDVSGTAIEAEVGVMFDRDNMLRAFVRVLWVEGPDGSDSGYIPLYPTRHSNSGFRARYGIFDLMPMSNVFSLQGGLHFNPDPQWTLGATVVWATTDEATLVGVPGVDDDYGWELDVWGEYRFTEQLTFGAGVAFLFPDDEGQILWALDDGTHVLIYMQARLVF